MVIESTFVRSAYSQMLAHEMRKVLRLVRAFPLERLDARRTGCGHSARELAEGFLPLLRRIDSLASGSAWSAAPRGARTRGSILLELESSYLGVFAALESLSPECWTEVIATPTGLAPWDRGRRGELLWLALRQLVSHTRHFALHVREACGQRGPDEEGGGHVMEPEPVAVGA